MDINVRFYLNKLNVVCNIKIACFAQKIQKHDTKEQDQ